MLRYENSRFHLDNISFQIPEGFLLEDCSGEDSSLTLAPPDHSFTLELRVNHGCMDAETELSYLFRHPQRPPWQRGKLHRRPPDVLRTAPGF